MYEKNMERVLKYTKSFGICDEETLNRILKSIPEESSIIFKARWGLDGGSFCQSFKNLDKKISKLDSREEYSRSETIIRKKSPKHYNVWVIFFLK